MNVGLHGLPSETYPSCVRPVDENVRTRGSIAQARRACRPEWSRRWSVPTVLGLSANRRPLRADAWRTSGGAYEATHARRRQPRAPSGRACGARRTATASAPALTGTARARRDRWRARAAPGAGSDPGRAERAPPLGRSSSSTPFRSPAGPRSRSRRRRCRG